MVVTKRLKRYTCNHQGCEKAYTRPCLLEEHRRSHCNTRPFVCDVCAKSFFRETHLKSHMWTHAEKKPLGCEKCPKRFITNQQLQRHLKTHLKREQRHANGESTGSESTANSSSNAGSPVHLSFPETHVGETIRKALKFECPFDCAHSFFTVTGLSDHMLEDHITTDTISPEEHLARLTESFAEASQVPEDAATWTGFDWNANACREVECQHRTGFPDSAGLMLHYAQVHEFVPDTLLQDYLFNVDEGL